jgi:alkanesulfonate monooxygenase SsuD/methylene tetrahydromethanopterin reductase-like flavin-dependent oxidoreductase (luciferase family)
VPFEERWGRFDEGLALLRVLLRGETPPAGRFYPVGEVRLEPTPVRPPEVWCGSWESATRLQRLAELADGWLASAYNTDPVRFAADRRRLDRHLEAAGRDPAAFPDLIATAWCYVSDDRGAADRVLAEVLGPILQRAPDQLRAQLPVGPSDHCVALLRRYAEAGAHQVLLWPVRDPVAQLERIAEVVVPELSGTTQRPAGGELVR